MSSLLKRHEVTVSAILALLLSFAAYLLPLPAESKALLFPILIVFIPASLAILISALTEGRSGLRDLFGTIRLPSLRWTLISIVIGIALQVAITLIGLLVGTVSTVSLSATPLLLAVYVFALGEELGWRGFATRKLLKIYSPLVTSILIGSAWALIHVSLFLPDMMFVGRPLIVQIVPIAFFAAIFTWLFARSGSNVITTTLMHGTFNAGAALLNSGMDATQATYIGGAVLIGGSLLTIGLSFRWWLHSSSQNSLSVVARPNAA